MKLQGSFSPRNTNVRGPFTLASKDVGHLFPSTRLHPTALRTNGNLNKTKGLATTQSSNSLTFKICGGGGRRGAGVANRDWFWQHIQKRIAINFETLLLLITIQILGAGASQWNFGCLGKFSINTCLKKRSRWHEGQSLKHLLEQMFACFCPRHRRNC